MTIPIASLNPPKGNVMVTDCIAKKGEAPPKNILTLPSSLPQIWHNPTQPYREMRSLPEKLMEHSAVYFGLVPVDFVMKVTCFSLLPLSQ